jgi:hypothetical protein
MACPAPSDMASQGSHGLSKQPLEALARHNPITETAGPAESTDSHMQRRRRLAEPEEGSPRGHTAKEQREVLRKACGLPHYDGDYAEYFRQIRGTQTWE